jgi:hypothetical protein
MIRQNLAVPAKQFEYLRLTFMRPHALSPDLAACPDARRRRPSSLEERGGLWKSL